MRNGTETARRPSISAGRPRKVNPAITPSCMTPAHEIAHHLVEPRHGDVDRSLRSAGHRQPDVARRNRDGFALLNPEPGQFQPAAPHLPRAQARRHRLTLELGEPAQDAGGLRVDRPAPQWTAGYHPAGDRAAKSIGAFSPPSAGRRIQLHRSALLIISGVPLSTCSSRTSRAPPTGARAAGPRHAGLLERAASPPA